MTVDPVEMGLEALSAGRWAEARTAFESALSVAETADARFGLASSLWWLGDNRAAVREATRAYCLFRNAGDPAGAIQCAVWLTFIYRADFGNLPAANGWSRRAQRMLTGLKDGPLHGWVRLARAYVMTDLPTAERLTQEALARGRAGEDRDLELSALAQLGKIAIGRGHVADGFALIDEAMVAALAGEGTTFDTVVYASCDMLSACEIANDLERAEHWCRVADDFVDRFGCPFLYAECRIYYGSVLVAKGRWADAEQELTAAIRVTAGISPGLQARALIRLAGLRIRQGRLEEVDQLLGTIDPDIEAEATLTRAALQLARGDATSASRTLEGGLEPLCEHRTQLGAALDLLVDAYLDMGDLAAAQRAANELSDVADTLDCAELEARAAGVRGRVAAATGDVTAGVAALRSALAIWIRLNQPFESAQVRSALSRLLSRLADPAGIDHLRRALSDFQTLGASLEADRLAAELRFLGVRTPPGAKGVGVLTEREQQVLRLLAAGLTNPEIASRLHMSRKTAAHHVSHILTKLNVRNRAQAAVFATADGRPVP